MTHNLLPAIWLIVFIAGLPQLSETVYTPSLPDIAISLQTTEAMVEYTLTIYLFGFAIGTIFWGKLSDRIGRKPCVLYGFIIFVIGCISCYFSNTIEMLMFSRFIQSYGASTGSVLGQAISRDSFHGAQLGRVYSSVSSSLAIFPAIGPAIGGIIAEYCGWRAIFLFLILVTIILTWLIILRLPETHHAVERKKISSLQVATSLIRDKKVIGFGLIVAGCNGISFSYFAEGSFYLIKLLGLSPSQYGYSFLAIAAATMLGGMLSKKLQNHHISKTIMRYGLIIILISSLAFSCLTILFTTSVLPNYIMVIITIISQMIIMFGVCMATSNALALALVDYKWCIGTASSLFGFFYYFIISLFTLVMGYLHNGTLLPMPLYFLAIAIFMIIIQKLMIKKK